MPPESAPPTPPVDPPALAASDADAVGGWLERATPEFGVRQMRINERVIQVTTPGIYAVEAFIALRAVFDLVTDDGEDTLSHKTVRCREVVRTIRETLTSVVVNPPEEATDGT